MATTSVSVTAQWALQGKDEDRTGYHVLAHSKGSIGITAFDQLLARYSIGTLEALPQVSFSWFKLEPDYYRAIAFHEFRNDQERDADGRRIAFTRYFIVPYSQLADRAISYRALQEAFRDIGLPSGDGAPISVTIPVSEHATTQDKLALHVAGLLLTGRPVGILGADEERLSRRLTFIDDVMALLPYGMRSQLSAATWLKGSFQGHKYRLFFQDASRQNGEDHVVDWGSPDHIPIEDARTKEYLNWLRGTRDASARLATLTTPTGFSPDGVRQILAQVVKSQDAKGHVFISYVREDSHHVDQMQRKLEEAGIRVWRDTSELWPGEDWRRKIRRAIEDEALVFIACFSAQSLVKPKSYQNAELLLAIEQLRLRSPEDPWLIPVRFDDCEIPDRDIGADRTLASIQRADLFGERTEQETARLVGAVMRILGRDVRPNAVVALSRAESSFHSFARSLARGRVTREQLLRFLENSSAGMAESWTAAPESGRAEALALLLDQRDAAASRVLAARWDVVGPDALRLAGRALLAGQTAEAEFCLGCLESAGLADAADRLLGRLLVPTTIPGKDNDGKSRYLAAAARFLTSRPVPARGTFGYCRSQLRLGDHADWQAYIVFYLLADETMAGQGSARLVGWLEWLCRTESGDTGNPPDWIAALAAMLPGPPSDRTVVSLRTVVSVNDNWATLLLRLARDMHRLPEILAAASRSMAEMVGQGITSGKLSGKSSQAGFIVGSLSDGLWREQVPPEDIAAADVMRVLLAGEPEKVPLDELPKYLAGLKDILALEAVKPWRHQAGQRILAGLVGGLERSDNAIMLYNTWSADENLAPGLTEFMAATTERRRPYDIRLRESFWICVAADPRLRGYASAGQLLTAAHRVAENPDAISEPSIGKTGMLNTGIALAYYEARLAGLPVDEIFAVLRYAKIHTVLTPGMLDEVLREAYVLLHYRPRAAGADGLMPEQELLSVYKYIARGALDIGYGELFQEVIVGRLEQEVQIRDELLRALKPRNQLFPGRKRK